MIVSEAYKMAYLNRTERFLHFSRNKRGKEVDLILQDGQTIRPFEIKSGMALRADYGANMDYFASVTPDCDQQHTVIYAGDDVPSFSGMRFVNWKKCDALFTPRTAPYVFNPQEHMGC